VAHLEVGGVTAIDTSTNTVRHYASSPGTIGLDVAPNAERVWSTNAESNVVTVSEAATGKAIAEFGSTGKHAVRVKLTPDGKLAVVVNAASKSLALFDAATFAFVGSIPLGVEPKILTISPDGRRAVVTSPADDCAVIVDLTSRAVVARVATGKKPDGAAWARTAVPYSSRTTFTLPERDLVPEGIAHDPATGAFFLGSTYKRKIVRVDRSGTVTDFIREGGDGLLGVVGMKVDAKRRVLWALSGDAGENMPMRNMDAGGVGRSSAHAYDLGTGALMRRYSIDTRPAGHFLNDLAIDEKSGTVYATDSVAGAIYMFSLDRPPEVFVSTVDWPNGIALSEDGRRLFVATREGVVTVDTRSRNVTRIGMPDGDVIRADGLYVHRGALVAIQPSRTGLVVSRYVLDKTLTRVQRAEVIEGNHPAFLQPTTGVVTGDSFYYIANSQLQHFRKLWLENGSVPLDKLRDVVVLRVSLD